VKASFEMASSVLRTGDPILRAYANLKAVRENLPGGFVHEKGLYLMYNQALDELQQAGADVSEWRMPYDAVGETDAKEFAARIDAILMYFTVQEQKTQIGFRS
jgi:hypothetical protein